jgi:hypothetical protein
VRPNEAVGDRIARAVLGLAAVLVSSTLLEPGVLAGALAIGGSILVVTAVVGWCLLYEVLGIRTRGPTAGR